jgi:N-acetylglucosaminyl-diphospho-decaprenol L-rhamnosyltransferase
MPAGRTFRDYDLSSYALRSGCVVTYNLHGYAFLIRRSAFADVGGFDPIYGVGFFEDRDLSRKLIAKGRSFGIHPRSVLDHRVHGSFDQLPSFREMIDKNRELYFDRHPGARRNVLLVSGRMHIQDLGIAMHVELRNLLREGGSAHWLTRSAPGCLPALEVRFMRSGLRGIRRLLRWHSHKKERRITEIWLSSDASPWLRYGFRHWAASHGIPIRTALA